MYIKEVTIDGFKSYAQRVVVPEFDRYFNAITVSGEMKRYGKRGVEGVGGLGFGRVLQGRRGGRLSEGLGVVGGVGEGVGARERAKRRRAARARMRRSALSAPSRPLLSTLHSTGPQRDRQV